MKIFNGLADLCVIRAVHMISAQLMIEHYSRFDLFLILCVCVCDMISMRNANTHTTFVVASQLHVGESELCLTGRLDFVGGFLGGKIFIVNKAWPNMAQLNSQMQTTRNFNYMIERILFGCIKLNVKIWLANNSRQK